MKLMVIILNKIDSLEYLLEGLSAAGIGGATIIESSGMAMTLSKLDSSFVSASIRAMFSSDGNEDNRTIISVIRNDQLTHEFRIIGRHLFLQYRAERIRNPTKCHLISGSYKSVADMLKRQDGQDGCIPCHCLRTMHLLFFDHQRDHPGARQLLACADRIVPVDRGDHHFSKTVHALQLLPVDLQKSVYGSPDLDLPFTGLRSRHGLRIPHADLPQNLGRFVFVKHPFGLLPYV